MAAGFAPDDPGDDVLLGGSGDDLVAFAAAGDDRLDGGPGDDTIQGGQGNDRLSEGPGVDILGTPVDVDVEEGDDRLLGGSGGDGLDGGPGFDRLNGQAGVDSCANGEVLVSCEASAAAAASQRLATTARATRGYGRQEPVNGSRPGRRAATYVGQHRRAPRGIRTPNRQIRSLVLCVGLVGSRRIWPAHLGCLVDLVGSRRVPSDRLDDQNG